MDNQQPSPFTLPLDALFETLEKAGFDTSPATRVRAWRVLEGLGREKFLRNPAALKTYLAPVFVRNAAEQERFYGIFDRAVEDWKKPDPDVELVDAPTRDLPRLKRWSVWEKPPLKRWPEFPIWGKMLIAIALLGLAVFLWIQYRPAQKIILPEPDFATQLDVYAEGDTVTTLNTTDLSKQDTSVYAFSWAIERADGRREMIGPTAMNWRLVVPAPDTGAQRQIVLTLRHKPTGQQKSKYSNLVIACKTPPRIPKLILPTAVVPDKPHRFGLAEKPRRGFAYRWQIIGDTLFDTPAFTYTFTQDGTYEVSLVVRDTTQPGACTADTTFTIRVGDEKVTLPYKTLQTDKAEPVALYGWLTYLLMALLGMGMIWTWVKWAVRKAPAPDLPAPSLQTTPPGGWGSDKPPYFIPFREQKGVLRTSREQFRLGDALRMRQEGQHRVLDVRATLRATLDRGGYPTIRYRYLSRPTDYLFLVDEQLPGNHLARLFRHLAENLRGQDVALEMFWYDADFHRFWNRSLPEGTSLEGLQRLFPEHRLVLLGNGHQLVYQSAESTPRLRPQLVASLRGWRDRLLLTPALPEVWNWREGALFQQFPLFPADLRGLSDAAVFIETGLDAEDMPPSFWTWQERQRALRAGVGAPPSHPDTKSAKTNSWKTAQDHETYLAPYAPDLMRWLRALAVTPSPVWETTLAIARALGISVTHDRLLALARVPALQEGEWHPRLRRELLKTLDPNDERRARLAVREELEAVREQAKNSHAALDLESSLAVQQFIIDPDDEANQTLVLSLLDAGLLSRRQEDELDFAVARIGADATTFRAWIDKPLPDAPPQPKPPFFTPMFWRAAALSLLFLLIFAFGWRYSGTAELRRMVFSEREFVPGVDTLRDVWWVQEDWVVDSALIYNNLGVSKVRSFGAITIYPNPSGWATYFERAQQLRAPAEYPLAQENLVKLWYNRGAMQLTESTSVGDWQNAMLYFSHAQTLAGQQFPGHRLDAIHGNGVAVFYTGLKDTATSFYDQLNATGYFDTLALRPNLETLLGIAQTRILNVTITNQSNRAVRTNITYQIGKKLSQNLYFTASAVDKTGKIIAFSQATLSHSKPGQYQDPYTFILLVAEPSKPAQADSLLIRLYDNDQRKTVLAQWKTAFDFKWSPSPAPEVKPPNLVTPESTPQQLPLVDRDRDGTPDDKDNCPDDPYKTEPGACGCGKPDTDTDGDGIPDCNDDCPNEKGEAADKGCPPPVAAADLSAILDEINRNMISVRGGTFTMGCTKEQGKECYNNEYPAHLVSLSNYSISKTEVTNEQFFAFMNDIAPKLTSSDGANFQYDGKNFYQLLLGTISWQKGRFVIKKGFEQHPAVRMSWYAATEYCQWLVQKTGRKYRLPTEAEWEFAARGGNNSKKTKYAGSYNIEDVAWYAGNSDSYTHPVGQKQANELGIFDLSGNVWEWCSDWYGDYEDTGKPVLNQLGAEKGAYRVYRGGSWGSSVLACRATNRNFDTPDYRNSLVGFRIKIIGVTNRSVRVN